MPSEYGQNSLLSYNKYLRVEQLLEQQHLLSVEPSHDELLFIIIHQTYELWFKQILHEIDGTIGWIGEDRLFRANHSMRVITSIETTLVNQIHTLETMAPIGFLEFRDKLNPASGFQSMQFREVEFSSGAKDEKILATFEHDSHAYPRLKKRFDQPSLADAFWSLLERNKYDVSTHEAKIDSIVNILRNPEKHENIYVLQDLLIEHDEKIALWRSNHVLMVERMLGMKRGTGGSDGVDYLASTLRKKFFPELWEARTHLKL